MNSLYVKNSRQSTVDVTHAWMYDGSMATWDEIKSVRLAIHDPSLVIDLDSVATVDLLPVLPKRQTAYLVVATGLYMIAEWTADGELDQYVELELRLSDSRVTAWINEHGTDEARCYALRDIMRTLWAEASLQKVTTGAESSEFTKLLDVYNFYRGLASDCEKETRVDAANSTGKFYTTAQPEIAGGNL